MQGLNPLPHVDFDPAHGESTVQLVENNRVPTFGCIPRPRSMPAAMAPADGAPD
jgi:hypothetical protein